MIEAEEIGRRQDEWTGRWHGALGQDALGPDAAEELSALVLGNHRANYDLWHEEDQARAPEVSDGGIARLKRSIDHLNQRRNDVVEAMDELLLREAPGQPDAAPLHSETPGMMIDRMSILALKIFHTREQVERRDATEAHRLRNADRLAALEEQRRDLTACLNSLWREVLRGNRRFKVYRQMKMYNDPELNPAIYGSRR